MRDVLGKRCQVVGRWDLSSGGCVFCQIAGSFIFTNINDVYVLVPCTQPHHPHTQWEKTPGVKYNTGASVQDQAVGS